MHTTSHISIPDHRGMAGSAKKRNLDSKGYHNIITRTHSKLDLTNQQAVNDFFETERPEYVFLAAAKVGGIHANSTYSYKKNIILKNNIWNHRFNGPIKSNDANRKTLGLI